MLFPSSHICIGIVLGATLQGSSMFSIFNQAALACTNNLIGLSGTSLNSTIRRILTTTQHTLTLLGLSSLIFISLVYLKPESFTRLQASFERITQVQQSSNNPALASIHANALAQNSNTTGLDTIAHTQQVDTINSLANPMSQTTASLFKHHKLGTRASAESSRQQYLVSDWLSKRYRVAKEATVSMVTTTYQTAREIEFDPLLILAVMAIESGLNPIAESPMGAQGLMQVMSKVHHDKFQPLGGLKEALNPVANIKVGSLILKDYVARGGSLQAGLKTYVGANAFDTAAGYGSRVIAEYQRLKLVAEGKPVPFNIAPPPPPAALATPISNQKLAPNTVVEEKEIIAVL
jgi:soluble lytic murein transglycosylase-like protein